MEQDESRISDETDGLPPGAFERMMEDDGGFQPGEPVDLPTDEAGPAPAPIATRTVIVIALLVGIICIGKALRWW